MNRCLRVLLLAFLTTFLTLASSAFAQHEQVYTFTGRNGSGSFGGLTVDAVGTFYGTTVSGGAYGNGVVFEISQVLNDPPVENVLYNFTGGVDGSAPVGNLIFDSVGNLYGVTAGGGNSTICTFGCGTVFKLSPPNQPGGDWTETVLYSFQGGPQDGSDPQAGVTMDQMGNLYGTAGGGPDSCVNRPGCGVVFELSPPMVLGAPWTETILHSFGGQPDGGVPMAPVIVDPTGNLYGSTQFGGLWNQGAVFEISPVGDGTWTESVIHNFQGVRGRQPVAGLTFGPKGSLFGTTLYGGRTNSGSVFQLNPPSTPGGKWAFVLAYSFLGGTGAGPSASVTFNGPATIYGTTALYGTVFRLSKSGSTWLQTLLHTFTGGKDGLSPAASLTVYNGALYGTTLQGGLQNDGVIFRVSR